MTRLAVRVQCWCPGWAMRVLEFLLISGHSPFDGHGHFG